ncbi:hypothetical protein EYF80_043927 [Liparis tanakae]|uniref:Uncharacterized protein n=1 Tax=Liparis tanakae TaxID=230148 RepID=A0A4Z2FXA0_9TELE|nr:hypothetical protein EYF80_043927 [Liparis tanakae]
MAMFLSRGPKNPEPSRSVTGEISGGLRSHLHLSDAPFSEGRGIDTEIPRIQNICDGLRPEPD